MSKNLEERQYSELEDKIYDIHDQLDLLMTDGKFDEVEEIIKSIDVSTEKSLDVLLSYIVAGADPIRTAELKASDTYLPMYREYYKKVYARFVEESPSTLTYLKGFDY